MSAARFGIVTSHPLPNHFDAQPNKLFEYLSAGLPSCILICFGVILPNLLELGRR